MMKPPARAYQAQITGRIGAAYVVGGFAFDGFRDGALIEVKGPGYIKFLRNGEFRGDFEAGKKILRQARNQLRVANGVPVMWHIAEDHVADAIRVLFEAKNVVGIVVHHTPFVHERDGR